MLHINGNVWQPGGSQSLGKEGWRKQSKAYYGKNLWSSQEQSDEAFSIYNQIAICTHPPTMIKHSKAKAKAKAKEQ